MPAPGSRRIGPERLALAESASPWQAEKQRVFERINADRIAHGVAPVAWEPRAALVGDRFCLDSALSGSWGHWDLQGRAPYLRWGLGGGVDFLAENAASFGSSKGVLERPLADILLERHQEMMDEQPPHDGHRRTILEPLFTHVGIGVAVVGGEVRMSQEFTRVNFAWIDRPLGRLRAGQAAMVAGRLLPGFEVGLAELRFEPPPRPLTLREVRSRGAYAYPAAVQSFQPRGSRGFVVTDPAPERLEIGQDGRVSVRVTLDSGPGCYYVLFYARRAGSSLPLQPAASVLLVVE